MSPASAFAALVELARATPPRSTRAPPREEMFTQRPGAAVAPAAVRERAKLWKFRNR